jgi:hypothetical protein
MHMRDAFVKPVTMLVASDVHCGALLAQTCLTCSLSDGTQLTKDLLLVERWFGLVVVLLVVDLHCGTGSKPSWRLTLLDT